MRQFFFTTKNGSDGLAIVLPHTSVSVVSVWTNSGSRYDPKGKEGLAHLYEHVMMKKTKKWGNEIDRLLYLEEHGITANAVTTIEFAYYHQTQLAEETEESFWLMEDGIHTSRMSETIFATEKKHVHNEKRERADDIGSRIAVISNRGLFSGSGIDTDVFGSSASLRSITLDDLRRFKKKNYTPKRLNYVVIIPDEKSIRHVATLVSEINIQQHNVPQERAISTIPAIVEERNGPETLFSLGFATVPLSNWKETVILHLIRDYLANNWTSRLVALLRLEHNVTYWVDGETANFSDTGLIRFSWWMRPKFLKKMYPLIQHEIERIKKEGVSEQELRRLKTLFISGFTKHMMNLEEILWQYGNQFALHTGVHGSGDVIDVIREITPSDIRRVASNYLTKERQSFAAVGEISRNDVLSVL